MSSDERCEVCGEELDDEICERCLKNLAKEVGSFFEVKERKSTEENYISCRDGTPSWIREMIYEAHSGMLPDDYKYRFVSDAVDIIADVGLGEPYIEADVYTSDLLKWVGSSLTRTGYCDDAIQEYGMDSKTAFTTTLAMGQELEKREVYDMVLNYLKDKIKQQELINHE